MRYLLVAALLALALPAHAATVTGRLLSKADNKPLAGLEIELRQRDTVGNADPKTWSGKTDDNGRFSWNNAPAAFIELRTDSQEWGFDMVAVRNATKARATALPPPPPAPPGGIRKPTLTTYPTVNTRNGDAEFGDILLVAGGALEINVIDEWERPCHATITLQVQYNGPHIAAKNGTSAKFGGLPEATFTVVAAVEGFWWCSQDLFVSPGTMNTYTLRVMEPIRVGLTVQNEDSTAVACTVIATPINVPGIRHRRDSTPFGPFTTVLGVNDTGKGSIELSRGRWLLDVRAGGYAPTYHEVEVKTRTDTTEVTVSKGTTMNLNAIEDGVWWYVLVRADSPALAWVREIVETSTYFHELASHVGVIAGDYRGKQLSAQLQPGKYWAAGKFGNNPLLVVGEVECPAEPTWELTFKGKENTLELTLTYFGKPIPELDVWLVAESFEVRRDAPSTPFEMLGRSDTNGVVRLTGLRSMKYYVLMDYEVDFAWQGAIRLLPGRSMQITEGENSRTVELGVEGATWLTIDLQGPADCRVNILDVRHLSKDVALQHRDARAFPNGVAHLGYVPVGSYEVEYAVRADGLPQRHGKYSFDTGAGLRTSINHTIELFELSGTFKFPNGTKRKSLTAYVVPADEPHQWHRGSSQRPAISSEGEKFTLNKVPAGEYILVVNYDVGDGKDSSAVLERVTLDKDIKNLKLSATDKFGGISLNVTGQGNEHHRVLHVRLLDASGKKSLAARFIPDFSPSRRLGFDTVPVGRCIVEVSGSGCTTQRVEARVKKGEETVVDIELKPSAYLIVYYNFGSIGSRAWILWTAEDANGNELELPGFSSASAVLFPRLPDKCARVRLRVAGHEELVVDVDSKDGAKNEHSVKRK